MKMSPENEKKLKILTAFLKIYPSSRLDEQGIVMYLRLLSSVSAAELQIAMQKIARNCKFFPSVAEIIQSVEQIRQALNPASRIPSVDEAWGEVTIQIREAYPYRKPKFSTQEITDTVRNMGWSMICETPTGDMNIVRAHFRDIYQNMLKRKRERAETNAILEALPEGKRGDIIRNLLTNVKTI